MREVASLSPVSTNALVKIECLEFPWTRNSLLIVLYETRGAEVEYGLNRVQLSLWLQQSLINGFSWYGLSWATVVSEHL